MTRGEASFICANIDRAGFEDEMNEALDMAIKALEQEPILDKIKAEIDELSSYVARFNGGDFAIHIDKEKVLEIIGKYREVNK